MRIDLPDPKQFMQIFESVTGESLKEFPAGIATDSRECSADDIFVAISGEQVDGHHFLDQVWKNSCKTAIVKQPEPGLAGFQQIQVTDPVKTIGKIARQWRRQFAIPVVGITGSNGKTTTKELLAHLLSPEFNVHVTKGNFNTSIGLPLTLLTLTGENTVSVLEMGANQPGDIATLAEIAEPTHGLITNIAPAHLEGFGNLETVARTKGELFLALETGTAFVNSDDELIQKLPKIGTTLTFGFSSDSDYAADLAIDSSQSIVLIINGAELATGSTNPVFARNLLAASAIATNLGLNWEQIQKQVKTFSMPAGRTEIKIVGHLTIIDDSYNANLASTRAAINYLSNYTTTGRRILVFGDMFESGAESPILHRQVGEAANDARLDAVFTVGKDTEYTDQALAAIPYHQHFESKDDLLADLKKYCAAGDVILVKGSRGMAMETIIEGLGDQ